MWSWAEQNSTLRALTKHAARAVARRSGDGGRAGHPSAATPPVAVHTIASSTPSTISASLSTTRPHTGAVPPHDGWVYVPVPLPPRRTRRALRTRPALPHSTSATCQPESRQYPVSGIAARTLHTTTQRCPCRGAIHDQMVAHPNVAVRTSCWSTPLLGTHAVGDCMSHATRCC
jgi:hypothetical protein